MRVLDLFSGIGGFSLGLERARMQTVAFCEIEPSCQRVLKKHWPDVPIYGDVKELTRERLESDGITGIDVICGGFPCQDISVAGKGAGLAGERSGLWSEFARLIGEIRPRYAIVENVAALLSRGLGTVLGDLAAIGYDAEWHCIPASYVGAPHRRDRLWIVSYASGGRFPQHYGIQKGQQYPRWGQALGESRSLRDDVADSKSQGRQRSSETGNNGKDWTQPRLRQLAGCRGISRAIWEIEPSVGRVANGIPNRVDRIRGLGNAVVPQIPELIGRAIMEAA